jgi:hypothetical protein
MRKKMVSFLLAVVLVMAFALPAMAADAEPIEGDSTVSLPTLNVAVPTSLNFALQPLAGASVTTGQITTQDFTLTNTTTDVAVLAAFYLDLQLAGGAVLDTASSLTTGGANVALTATAKKLALGIIASKTTAGTYDKTEAGTINYFTGAVGSEAVSVGFKLDEDGGSAAETKFAFYGVLNAYAPWAASDVKVSGVYLLKALSTQTPVTIVTDTVGLIDANATPLPAKPSIGPAADVTFTAAGTKTLTISRATATANGGITVYLAQKPATITSATNTDSGFVFSA